MKNEEFGTVIRVVLVLIEDNQKKYKSKNTIRVVKFSFADISPVSTRQNGVDCRYSQSFLNCVSFPYKSVGKIC
jgi:hypothetical protein